MIFVENISELVKKGNSLLIDSKFEEALDFFEQALLLNQNDPNLWNNKGVALRSLGRYEEAMVCFNKSLEIDPRDKFSS
jgi:Flp pilus assembly protein TadD